MNSVNLIGRLARDPELRYTQSGTAVCSFVLAVRNPYKQDEDGNYGADFINCVAWQTPAEMIAESHQKGDLLAISGRIQTRSYENNDGEMVWVTEVNAENIHFIKPKEDDQDDPKGNRNGSRKGSKTGTKNNRRNVR